MTESHPTEQEPKGYSSPHRTLSELEQGLRALPPAPTDSGRVTVIVCRHAPEVHETLARARLTLEEGVAGDDWSRRPSPRMDAQLAVIRHDVAELLSHGQPLITSGDNLFVDLDISTPNLPAGTQLRVGEAVVEVTPMPHNGCRKFVQRFGHDALCFVQDPATRHLNLRGIYWRVVEPGEVFAGAPIQVFRRPDCRSDQERPGV